MRMLLMSTLTAVLVAAPAYAGGHSQRDGRVVATNCGPSAYGQPGAPCVARSHNSNFASLRGDVVSIGRYRFTLRRPRCHSVLVGGDGYCINRPWY